MVTNEYYYSATKKRSLKDQHRQQIKGRFVRFRVIWGWTIFLFIVLFARLFYIQVVNAQNFRDQARKLYAGSTVIYSRGRILDRNGVVLAQDSILYDVYAHPRYYYKTTPEEISAKLSPILNMPQNVLVDKLKLPFSTIAVQKDIPKAEAEKIRDLDLPGIETPRKMVRRYPQGALASQVIGYVNDDASISTGVEKSAEKALRMPPNLSDMERDGHGDFMNVQNIKPSALTTIPKAHDVKLTIDSRIQYAAESALAEGLEKSKAKRGAAIVMNPNNGEILAFAVLPDYDPEKYATTPPADLTNWAITDVYPPGSTFKILTIAAGLETGVINKNSILHDTGFVKMGGYTIQNYDYATKGAPGDINLVYLLEHSSNIGALLVSLMMDPAQHYKILHNFGLGQKTGIDIPGESAGILHPPQDWSPLLHATLGFGYGLAATPIQMATAVASLANKGVWVTPHVIMNDPNIQRHRVLSEKTTQVETQLLTESIDAPKTSSVRLDGFELAGKTGTSRKPADDGRGYSSQVYTSFVGFFPAEKPRVLVMVVVDSPQGGNAWGSTVAGPIFKSIAKQTIGYLGLKPDMMATKAIKTSS